MFNNLISSFISFDVEALPGRAPDHIFQRLVWGKTDSGSFGISKICDILDSHKIIGNFMIELGGYLIHTESEISKVIDFIQDRGHEVHAHLHPELLIRSLGYKPSIRPDLNLLDECFSDLVIGITAELFIKFTGKQPQVFRSGAYLFNTNTLNALKKNGFKMVTNFNSGRHKDIILNHSDLLLNNNVFEWDNGLIELPVDLSPEPLTINFEKYIGIYDRVSKKRNIKTFNLTLHSWSLLKRDINGMHTEAGFELIDGLEKICQHLLTNTNINTYSHFLEEMNENNPNEIVPVSNVINLKYADIKGP